MILVFQLRIFLFLIEFDQLVVAGRAPCNLKFFHGSTNKGKSYLQESEGFYIPLFIRTVRATFTAHGSSPKNSVSCRHASFRFILSNVPPRVLCCHSTLYRKKRSGSFKVYSFYIFPVALSSN